MPKPSIKDHTGRFVQFVTRDIWLEEFPPEDHRRRGVVSILKWLYLVGHGFVKDQCLLRASALTYTTVLSIVPFLAVAFSISKGMGLQNTETLRMLLLQGLAGNEQTVDHILTYVNRTNVGTLGTVGMVTLLATVGSLMATIEKAFNAIWGVRRGRTLWRKFTDFFSVVLICPLIMGVAVSVSMTMQHDAVVQQLLSFSAISYMYVFWLKLVPILLVALTLLFVYSFIPNTKVCLGAGAAGALLAALLWKWVENIYVTYQIGTANYNAIYGGFAQVPLFLVWVYVSWVVVLLGGEISFALQNVKTFENEIRARSASQEERDKLAVSGMLLLTQHFQQAEGAVSVQEIARTLRAPVRLIQDIFTILQQVGLVVQTCDNEIAYVLAVPPGSIRFTDILSALALYRTTPGEFPLIAKFSCINETFSRLYTDIARSSANVSLQEYYESGAAEEISK